MAHIEVDKDKDSMSKAIRVTDEDELEDDDDDVRIQCRRNSNPNEHSTKEISASYSVPHYPIELEEQKKIVAQQIVLKELEERASHASDEPGM